MNDKDSVGTDLTNGIRKEHGAGGIGSVLDGETNRQKEIRVNDQDRAGTNVESVDSLMKVKGSKSGGVDTRVEGSVKIRYQRNIGINDKVWVGLVEECVVSGIQWTCWEMRK